MAAGGLFATAVIGGELSYALGMGCQGGFLCTALLIHGSVITLYYEFISR